MGNSGSNPDGATWGYSIMASTPDCLSENPGSIPGTLISGILTAIFVLAQLVEHLTFNQTASVRSRYTLHIFRTFLWCNETLNSAKIAF